MVAKSSVAKTVVSEAESVGQDSRGSHGIRVAESSVSESMVAKSSVAKTVVSEAESVGQDSRGSLDGGLLVSGPLPAGLALLQAGDGVAEGGLAAGLVDGILNDGHGHLDLVHHGLGHGVGVAESMVAQTVVASKAAIGQTPVGQNNLRGGSSESRKHQQAVHCWASS